MDLSLGSSMLMFSEMLLTFIEGLIAKCIGKMLFFVISLLGTTI